MNRSLKALVASISALFSASGVAIAQASIERLVTSQGERMENVIEASDGSFYMTGVLKSEVLRRAPDGTVSVFLATKFPQGVLQYGKGFVVDGQEREPDFKRAGGFSFAGLGPYLVVVDASGKVTKRITGPDENAFYNGMAFSDSNTLLIADPGGGRILKADLKKNVVSVWLDKPALVSALGEMGSPNGLKVRDGWAYFARGDVYKVKIGSDGKPDGKPVLAGKTGGTDDFDVAADGAIYATSQKGILKIASDGAVSTLLADAPFATAVRVSRDGKSVFVTGGGLPGMPGSVDGYLIKVAAN